MMVVMWITSLEVLSDLEHLGSMEDPKGNQLDLAAFSDPDWAGCVDTRKSTSGVAFFLGGCLVSWSSKKQSSITLPTAEAEYAAAVACCT